MLAASLISPYFMSKQLQMQAQSHLEQARFYKTAQQFKMALVSYDQARVIFKHAEDASQQVLPLSELKSAFSQAHTPQTPEDESLRQRIAEVYVERAEVLESLGKLDKAKKSYEKAQAWGYEGLPAASTAALISSSDSARGLAQSAAFFSASASLAPSPKVAKVCLQEKHQWVAQVFETILKQFQDLDLCQSSPNLFLVYAHNNNRLGKADAEASQQIIKWLSNLRSNLYSDRSVSGHQALPFSATLEDMAKANDILSSQLCLLPNHAGTVDHVVLCGSELLGHYMASTYYHGFYQAIQRAYQEASQPANDFAQVEAAIRKVVDANLNEKEFHHVLTELAFLQIRYEHHQDQHGIIPLLLNSTAQQCLPKFIIDSTTIRIEDSIWRTPSLWNGRHTYQDEGLHIGFFKLVKRLLVKQERYIALVEEKIYQVCLQKLREDQSHTLTAEAFSLFLNQTCVTALEALKQDHGADLRELNVQKAYESILIEIKQINGEAFVAPDQLRLALEASYSAKRLAIQRLSGPPLSMEHCYINLAVVESEKEKASKEEEAKQSKEEVQNHFYRLPSAEAIRSNLQKFVLLEKLFEPRELSKDKTVIPKRILIRGRAGAGKTTLSKKIVYEYTQKGQWRDRFDYVLWIPLRTLKGKSHCDLATLFHETYFSSHPKGQSLAKTLAAQINGVAKEKTLFVLDGWDEVAQEWDEHEPMYGFLKQLLNQPAVLITSRPYIELKQADPMDLELETVGFSPENVTAYLDNPAMVSVLQAQEMKQFIQTTSFIQGLVNVPIQLDALCYSWDEIKRMQKESPDAMTVTALYQAMKNKLWRKDILRLGKREGGKLLTESQVNALESSPRVEKLVRAEHDFLSTLAFQGMQRNQIEFSHRDLHALIEQLERKGLDLPMTLEDNLKKLSFLHTDEAEEGLQSYHFMHLTFQEFFAAKHFVRHWEAERDITQLSSDTLQWKQVPSEAFVGQHKYNPRYEIFWWFVAGLLRGEALNRFFDLLEAEPRDLSGAYHQRLIMNGLHEASQTPDVGLRPDTRSRLEQGLWQWLLLEIDKTDNSTLAYQSTFPEHVLLECLHEGATWAIKREVISALGRRSALSTAALQALIALTNDSNRDVRGRAADALGQQSLLPERALQALIALTKDSNMKVVSSAVNALGKQSSLPESALQALIALMKDEDWEVRRSAADALGHQSSLPEPALQTLIALTIDGDNWVRCSAADALGHQSSLPESALQALIALMKDQDREVRRRAASALGHQSLLPEWALQALIALTKDQDSNVRHSAAYALGQQSSLPELALQALIVLMKDRDSKVSDSTADALGRQSSLPEWALQVLIALTKNPDRGARYSALKVLGHQSLLPEPALQTLIALTRDGDNWVKRSAADALGHQSSLPEWALQALIALTKDQVSWVMECAVKALGHQSSLPESALLALIALMKDPDSRVSDSAAEALYQRSSLPEWALKALIALTKDQDSMVRCSAASALGHQSLLPESALQALIALTKDEDNCVRRHATKALGHQSSLPEWVLQALIALTEGPDNLDRGGATEALGRQSSLPEWALLALIALMEDQDDGMRCHAASVLGQQSSLSESALLALIALTKDENMDVRHSATSALAKHRWTLYRLLPTFNRQQIELLYTGYLLKQSFDQGAPLYIQKGSLYFYTAQGRQRVPFSDADQEVKFKQAIQQAQQAAGLPLALRDRIVQPGAQSEEKTLLAPSISQMRSGLTKTDRGTQTEASPHLSHRKKVLGFIKNLT